MKNSYSFTRFSHFQFILPVPQKYNILTWSENNRMLMYFCGTGSINWKCALNHQKLLTSTMFKSSTNYPPSTTATQMLLCSQHLLHWHQCHPSTLQDSRITWWIVYISKNTPKQENRQTSNRRYPPFQENLLEGRRAGVTK